MNKIYLLLLTLLLGAFAEQSNNETDHQQGDEEHIGKCEGRFESDITACLNKTTEENKMKCFIKLNEKSKQCISEWNATEACLNATESFQKVFG
jgi:hypothetical protein